jgi:zinc-ribbon domain
VRRNPLSTPTLLCTNCGASVQSHASFCHNCGARITAPATPAAQIPPNYYPPVYSPPTPVSTGPYKGVIAILLIIILIMGIVLAVSAVHLPLSFGNYHYTLTTPPSLQSTKPGPATTSQFPQYTIWNACGSTQSAGCTMSANGWREGSVPDTFDYYVSFTSTVGVTVYFLTMGQFVQFSVCNGDINCVSGYYDSIPATTSLPTTLFTLARGCADYLAIYVASGSGTMYPDVGVTQNPASTATGYCAQAGT